jgi:hypothetical protein
MNQNNLPHVVSLLLEYLESINQDYTDAVLVLSPHAYDRTVEQIAATGRPELLGTASFNCLGMHVKRGV